MMRALLNRFTRSISHKLRAVVMATSLLALLISAAAMMAYEIRNYRSSWVADLSTQASILARVSTPALQFNDPATAYGNLQLLKVRPQVLEAALYGADGKLFAAYRADPTETREIPPQAQSAGYRIVGDQIAVHQPVVENKEIIGTVYLLARYELAERVENYILILLGVMLASLAIAGMFSGWLQKAVTKPILAVTSVARKVMEQRDFSLRVEKSTEDEIGVLVDAFNDMLTEVGGRTTALEASNLTLRHEMKERGEAEEALRIADRRKDEFLATLAHELRNPLAPLMSGLEIMRMTGPASAASQRSREIMERQLRQMVRLVDDLLDVSRISTGRLAIKTAHIELQAVIQSAIETVSSLLASRGHSFTLVLPERPVYLQADAVRLAQVFSNLLNNSCKYTDPDGQIRLEAALQGSDVVVTVSDDGIGLSAEMVLRIFDMFTQVDYSLERSQTGLGVGLTLAKRLVELHGGTLQAFSGGPGQGSSFVVRLPVAGGELREVAQDGYSAQAPAPQPYRILLADDNVDFATSLAELLRSLGHEVQVTHDGSAALAAAAEFRPAFAFLDIGLPGLNGYDLAKALRAHPATRDAVLASITGWGQERDRQMAWDAGFDHHMVKPVNLARIVAILDLGPLRAAHARRVDGSPAAGVPAAGKPAGPG